MELHRRRWRVGTAPPAFPAWRIWEDSRVRADNNVMALFAAARIAKTCSAERARTSGQPFVSDLYTVDELPFRGGFRLSLTEAMSRWEAGMEDLSRMAIVVGVAAIDDLLGAIIQLLRATGHDRSRPGSVDTGVSAKLEHLRRHGHLDLSDDTQGLYGLLVEVRHAVTHYGGRQRPVRQAWDRLGDPAREWWIAATGRALPLTRDTEELRVGDRELLGALKTLDRVALEIARGLQATLTEAQWADLVVAEYRQLDRAKANDSSSNVRRIKRFADSVWRMRVSDAAATAALSRPTPDDLTAVAKPPTSEL